MINDAHCHFFSSPFLAALAAQRGRRPAESPSTLCRELGWEDPGSPEELADRWVRELDRSGVARAALIASVPGDEASVAAAVARHPSRLVGFFTRTSKKIVCMYWVLSFSAVENRLRS